MADLTLWIIALGLGIVIWIAGIIIFFKSNKNEKDGNYGMPIFLEFIAAWIMYWPSEFYRISVPVDGFRVIESILLALLKNISAVSGNGLDIEFYKEHLAFFSIYTIFRILVNLTMLLFFGRAIVQYVKKWRYGYAFRMHKRYKTYIFSEVNKKTLAIAKSIPEKDEKTNKKIKRNIIFACSEKDLSNEEFQEIEKIGAICIDKSVDQLTDVRIKEASGIEIFLFAKEEKNNLIILKDVCKRINKKANLQKEQTSEGKKENSKNQINEQWKKDAKVKIFVELTDTPWSYYDSFLGKNNLDEEIPFIVNFLRTEESFAYNHLLKNSIFETAVGTGKYEKLDEERTVEVKEIKFLIVGGMNNRNLEMLKAVLHLGQMPFYRLSVIVLEEEHERSKLRYLMPEVYDSFDVDGDAVYSLEFHEGIQYESDEFEQIIQDIDFTTAFINTEDDIRNVNIATKIEAVCEQKMRRNYKIWTNINDGSVKEFWDDRKSKSISFVGSVDDVFAYNAITMPAIEKMAKAIHEIRYKDELNNKEKSWLAYCNNEYNRHSVFARALNFKHKVQLIEELYPVKKNEDPYRRFGVTSHCVLVNDKETSLWKKYEHMRWNMYTRTLGYKLCSDEFLKKNGKESEKIVLKYKKNEYGWIEADVPRKRPEENKEVWKKVEKEYTETVIELGRTVRESALVHQDLVTFDKLPLSVQEYDSLKLTKEVVDVLMRG